MFLNFCEGQPVLSYIHFLFKDSPFFEMKVRKVDTGNRGEVGLNHSRTADRTSEMRSGETSSRKRKG